MRKTRGNPGSPRRWPHTRPASPGTETGRGALSNPRNQTVQLISQELTFLMLWARRPPSAEMNNPLLRIPVFYYITHSKQTLLAPLFPMKSQNNVLLSQCVLLSTPHVLLSQCVLLSTPHVLLSQCVLLSTPRVLLSQCVLLSTIRTCSSLNPCVLLSTVQKMAGRRTEAAPGTPACARCPGWTLRRRRPRRWAFGRAPSGPHSRPSLRTHNSTEDTEQH